MHVGPVRVTLTGGASLVPGIRLVIAAELMGEVTMEPVSLAAFWLALAGSSLATLLYWSPLLVRIPRLRPQLTPVGASSVDLPLDTVGQGTARVPAAATRLAGSAAGFVLATLVMSLAARWWATGHAPLTDMWEFTVAFAAAVSFFQVFFGRRVGQDAAGVLLQPIVLVLLVVAADFPSRVEPLTPALRSGNILVLHVGVMVVAYGALTISFAAAVLQLLQSSRHRVNRLPGWRTFDDLAYRSVVVGFPLLALGIALGAYWASTAWGRYWGWDPKETSALLTWLAYGVYFHLHGLRRWAGNRSAIVLVVAYGFVLFSYFAVNLWVSGLHSYAGV